MKALLMVEDNTTFAHTLLQFLRRFEGLTVVAVAESAEAALDRLNEQRVDLALIDVSLPGASGIDLLPAIRRQYPEVRCIMLSGHHEHEYVRRALAAGASGYVLKENPLDLIAAVQTVMAGETFLSVELRP